MGQQNEIEEPEYILNQLNSYEEKLQKENIFSEDSFQIAKNIAKEYISYKTILDKHPKKKQEKKNKTNNDNYDRNKLDEISHKFDRINKWIKMAKTPYKNNLQFFLNKITGEDKKIKNNNLFKDKSTDNIFGRGARRKNNNLNNNLFNQDFPETERKIKNNEPLVIKKAKKKKTKSSDKSKRKGSDNDNKNNINNNIIIQSYSDKNIEEKIISFYNHNKSKYKERLFKGPPECFRWRVFQMDILVYNK